MFGDVHNVLSLLDAIGDAAKNTVGLKNWMMNAVRAHLQGLVHGAHLQRTPGRRQRVNDAVACDAITFSCALRACTRALSSATEMHRVLRLAHNAHILSAEMVRMQLIHRYRKAGCVDECEQLVRKSDTHSAAVWNALISADGHKGAEEA